MRTQNANLNEVASEQTKNDGVYFHSFIVASKTPLSEDESRQAAEAVQQMINARDAEKAVQMQAGLDDDDLTDEEKMEVSEAIRHLELVGPEDEEDEPECCDFDCDNGIVPTPKAVFDDPLRCRHLETEDEENRLVKVVSRIPTTVPVHNMEKAAGAMLDYSYRLGYYDGIVDAFHNLELRGIKVPSLKDMEIG